MQSKVFFSAVFLLLMFVPGRGTAQWVQANLPLGGNITAVTAMGTDLFFCANSRGVFRSTDRGATWTKVNSGSSPVCAIVAADSDLFAGTKTSGVFRFSDHDTGWTVVNSGLTRTAILSLIAGDSGVFAGTDSGGVFRSIDNGANWTTFGDGLPANTSVHSFAAGQDFLFAGTGNSGVWRYSLAPTGVKNPKDHRDDNFAVKSASVNTPVLVSFSLRMAGPVTCIAYSLSGRMVAVLCDRPMTVGRHIVKWDTGRIPAGFYLIRLQAGATTRMKSVMLFR